MTFIPPRLRKLAMYALAGLLFVGAWLVHGSRLILDRDAGISQPACSGVMPAASRKRRNWLPSSMRSTVASTDESSRPENGCSSSGPTALINRPNTDDRFASPL